MVRPTRNRGFTLIELLVVIAIIGIMIALLMPAVQAAREAARLSVCRSNMKQIGIALHAYYDSNKKFPPGTTALIGMPTVGAEQGLSMGMGKNWVSHILPFLEGANIHDMVDWKKLPQISAQRGITAYSAATGVMFNDFTSAELPVMLCPSDKFNDTKWRVNRNSNLFSPVKAYQYYGRGNYGANACLAPPFNYSPQTGNGNNACGGPTQEAWNLNMPTSWMSRGVMGYSATLSMKQISDGLSKTVAVWEVRAGIGDADYRGTWADGRPAASTLWFHIWAGPNICNGASDDNAVEASVVHGSVPNQILSQECMFIFSSSSGAASGASRSMHRGGENGLFCDGSVRFVSDFVEVGVMTVEFGAYGDFRTGNPARLLTWERLNASADGLPVEEDSLIP